MRTTWRVLLLAVCAFSSFDAAADPEADRFFLHKRLVPGMDEYPAQKALEAYQKSLTLPLYSSVAGREVDAKSLDKSVALRWTSLGPGNVGGRTRAIRFEPGSSTRLYAGGVAGGVWRSDDAGATWTPLGDAMANMAVTAILVDPSNTQVLLAGTGEGNGNADAVRGAGIFRSTNGGTTWTQVATTAGVRAVNDMVYRPGSSTTVYAATNDGLMQSRNGGVSFTQITGSIPGGCHKVIYRSDADVMMASCGITGNANANVIVRSNNASNFPPFFVQAVLGATGSGATLILPDMGRTSLAIAPSNPQIIYALIACTPQSPTSCASGTYTDGLLAVYQSIDGGSTWSPRKVNGMNVGALVNGDLMLTNPMLARQTVCGYGASNQFVNVGTYANTIAVDPVDPNRVWVGGVDLWRSDNAGGGWGLASYWWFRPGSDVQWARAEHHAIAFDPAYNGTTNTTMYVSGDGGIFRTGNAVAATGNGGVMDASNSICGQTNLSTVSWGRLTNYGVTQFYHGSVYPGGTRYFGGTQDNSLVRGTDGSPNAWTTLYGLDGDAVSPWTRNGGDAGFTAIDNTPGNEALYMSNRGISIRRNASDAFPPNTTWATRITGITNTGCGLLINPFQMDPNNSARLYTSHNVLWRTADRGANWIQASAALSGTNCAPATAAEGERFSNYAIAPGNADLLVAGTDRGRICRLTNATTSNSGTALADCTTPAGTAYISAIAFDPGNTNTVYATVSTFDVGHVWRSANGGQTWTNIDGSGGGTLPNTPAHSIVVSPFAANTLYVGTDTGVFVTLNGGTSWAREHTGFANVITDHLVLNASGTTGQSLFAFTHGRGAFRAPLFPPADVGISATNGQTGVNAGTNGTYTITANNAAAIDAQSVTVVDNFPAALSGCTWTCSAAGGGTCTGSGNGNINEVVRIAAGNIVTFSATCTLPAGASGSLVNTATVDYPNDANTANDSATDTDAIAPLADLSITKTDGLTTVNPGANISYSITLRNPQPVAVSNVLVTDTFPAGLTCTWFCFATSGGSCGIVSGNGNINETVTVGPFAGSEGQVGYIASCTLAGNATGTLTNTATLTYGNDSNAANNSATDVDQITPSADVSISKTDGATSVNAGSTVQYSIVATNNGTAPIGAVTVADTFPATLTGCTWTCAASAGSDCGVASGNGNINQAVSLAAAGGTVTYAASCTLSAGATGALSNTATASYSNDPNTGNNSATDNSAILAPADVSISKTDGVGSVNAGSAVNYTIVATNNSAGAIFDVTVADTFPAALTGCTWTCAASPGGNCGAASGGGNISRVVSLAASGGTVTYTASCTVSAGASGILANTATVIYANDPNPGNNSALDNTDIVAQADVSISKTDGATSVNAGSTVDYTIVATNNGSAGIDSVLVADSFPATLSACTWTCAVSAGGNCPVAGGTGDFSVPVVLAGSGGTATFAASCTLAADASGTLSNTATVGYANDPSAGNNSASDATAIIPLADLSITKSNGANGVAAGAGVVYTIVASNPAAAAIADVRVADTFAATLTGCTWSCSASGAGSCEAPTGSGDINHLVTLVAGGTATFVATCTVAANATGSITNTATLDYANDPQPANDSATDTDTILGDGIFANGFE